MNTKELIKLVFLVFNAAVVLGGAYGFIIGLVHKEHYRYWTNYSFIGGYVAIVGLFFVIYGLLGLFGAYKNHQAALTCYGLLAFMSVCLRLVSWIIFAINGWDEINGDWRHYTFLVLEVGATLFAYILTH